MPDSDRQKTILQWLGKAFPHAGRMFESALRIAACEHIPCRGRMIAHAFREICSEIMNKYSPHSHQEIKPLLDKFQSEFYGSGIAATLANGPGSTPPVSSGPISVAVKSSFVKSAQKLVQYHAAVPRARDRVVAVFKGMQATSGDTQTDVVPTAEKWFAMSKYFTACAHDRITDDAQLMSQQFMAEAEFFEATLLSFAAPAVDVLDEMDSVLESANS